MPQRTSFSSDPSHDFLSGREPALSSFFEPKEVVLVGASEKAGSVGRALLDNLMRAPGIELRLVNPKHDSILGRKCFPKLADIGHAPELAILATPAAGVPGLVAECAQAGVKAAIIISAGFRELGPEGLALETACLAAAKPSGMRLLGPNCLGLMSPHLGLNLSFSLGTVLPGKLALLSQSGAMVTAILDWGLKKKIGFSRVASLGSMMDLGWGDMIEYLAADALTESIVIYMESIGEARSFISAARELALSKPIIVIKAGRSEAAAKAAASHTGSLVGSHAALEAAFKRCGILSVDRVSDLFYMAEALALQPRPKGPRLCVITNAGGPGVLAADALAQGGGQMAPLAPETLQRLSEILPPAWSHSNPIDLLGDADPARFAAALGVAAKDPGIDGILAILTPQAMTDPLRAAQELAAAAKGLEKPLLCCWMGGDSVEAARAALSAAGLPSFPFPDMACRSFNHLWRYSANLAALYETPALLEDGYNPDRDGAASRLAQARAEGRTLLSETESKQLLKSYGIPVSETRIAGDPQRAAALAKELGFPVALKLHSLSLTHKAELGGVKLNLRDEAEVKAAFAAIQESVNRLKGPGHFQGVSVQAMAAPGGLELILGSSVDSQLGPLLLFGSGGGQVELFHDSNLGLPPLNSTLARLLMEPTKAYQALLKPRQGAQIDLAALQSILVKFSRLVTEQPLIKEMDINPLLASPSGLLALDARVVLHDPSVSLESIPKPALRPYPGQYASLWTSPQGQELQIRPIRPEDEAMLAEFHASLSSQSVFQRYFQDIKLGVRTQHSRLLRACFADYDSEIALVAELAGQVAGVARLSRIRPGSQAEFSMIIRDSWQRQGLGSRLMQDALAVAKAEGITRLLCWVLPENAGMRKIFKNAGFIEAAGAQGGTLSVQKDIQP